MQCFRRQQRQACNLLVLFVLTSLIAFLSIVYFYAHLHVLPNGRIIVHSHAMPHSEKRGTSHSHTNLELQQLDQVSKTASFGLIVLFALSALFFFVKFYYYFCINTSSPYTSHFSRRAPPILPA